MTQMDKNGIDHEGTGGSDHDGQDQGGGAAGKFVRANNICAICEFIVGGGVREGGGEGMDVCG